MTDPISDKLLKDAIDRLARTPDGTALYLYLQRRLLGVAEVQDASALYQDQGARRFALELIGLMTKGIVESGGRTSSTNPSTGAPAEQPLVFAHPEPVTVRAPRGAGSRIGPDTRVPGWDTPGTGD